MGSAPIRLHKFDRFRESVIDLLTGRKRICTALDSGIGSLNIWNRKGEGCEAGLILPSDSFWCHFCRFFIKVIMQTLHNKTHKIFDYESLPKDVIDPFEMYDTQDH